MICRLMKLLNFENCLSWWLYWKYSIKIFFAYLHLGEWEWRIPWWKKWQSIWGSSWSFLGQIQNFFDAFSTKHNPFYTIAWSAWIEREFLRAQSFQLAKASHGGAPEMVYTVEEFQVQGVEVKTIILQTSKILKEPMLEQKQTISHKVEIV